MIELYCVLHLELTTQLNHFASLAKWLNVKQTLNNLDKLGKWLSCVVSFYLYGAADNAD